MRRYWGLFRIQLRASTLLALQYRSDFVLDGVIEVFWAITSIIPLFVVYRSRASVAGWSFGEALLVVGGFTLLQGVLEGAINPSLTSVVEHVRKGTLDFILIKPADAQFLVSTARFAPWRATNIVTAIVIYVYAFRVLGRAPTVAGIALAVVLLVAAITLLYSLWILTVSCAFYVVRIDNLTHLFSSIFDAARWPRSVFRGVFHVLFTFVIPLALMTSYPAEALLGSFSAARTLLALCGAALFAAIARFVWLRSIREYTSASS